MILLEIILRMLTAHKIKVLQSLDKKKFRQKYNLFLVEGNKNIRELLDSSYKITEIFSTDPSELNFDQKLVYDITDRELKKISFLQHPKDSIAVVEIPHLMRKEEQDFQLVLDGIQDPGNMGTIIRLADWFGITQIICSPDTVDVYNPKVVQASMGSFARVQVSYENLDVFFSETTNHNIGTDMDGENLYKFQFPEKCNLIMGNEGKGMRPETEKVLHAKICIPRFGNTKATESLNVSMASGIILGQIFSKK